MALPIVGEVWGAPISHSKSPDLHHSCYRHLGMAGTYDRREVNTESLPSVFAEVSTSLTGVSLTMPLKEAILDLVPDHRGSVDVLHAANTAVSGPSGWWLANTDPAGAAAMCRRLLSDPAAPVWLLGAGATARAVIFGLRDMGFHGRLTIAVRSPERAAKTLLVAKRLGVDTETVSIDTLATAPAPQLIVSTLPSGTLLNPTVVQACVGSGATLMDVGYHPWPTPLAQSFFDAGLRAHSGLPMLMFQALAQIRCFVNNDPGIPLADEAGALTAMANAVGLDPEWADPILMGQ